MSLNHRAHAASWFLIALMAVCPAVVRAGELPYNGTWTIQKLSASMVQFGVRARTANDTYEDDHSVPLSRLSGLSGNALAGSGDVKFDVVSDAGTLHCEGSVRNGNGGGTYAYEPNSRFGAALTQRAMNTPSPQEQYRMTLGGVTLAFIDTLRAQGYHPTTDAIIELVDHGVDENYVRGLAAAGLRLNSTDELVRARDHGVTVEYVKAMSDAGYRTTNVDELIRMRDHGVDAAFVRGLQAAGLRAISADELVEARDHGVSADFIAGLDKAGYHITSVEELVRLRDHGVSSAYAAGLRARSFNPSADDLIRLMDHGVSLAYIDRLRAHGYHPTIDELIRLRDAGV